ncbi:hypothetical protein [Aquimarina mytili]|uniref:Uncharacterized protein n=1 Tax=Aquimarina mytili TaxID=874423 RepID=A0A937A770_9FLAO|nr:hypothetical protein [Aquimarina mytili]MBL0685504.1 hypothetical protein [Aquimarina mytili]
MKKTIIAMLSLALCMSCGSDKQKEKEPGLFDIIDGVSDLNKLAKEVEEIEEEGEKLLKATPISNEELKAILPESLVGFTRKKFSVGNQFMADVAMAEAEYENEDGDMISLSIIDGAGETGSAMISLSRLGFSRDFEEQTDTGYKKSITLNGYKAVEEKEKDTYNDSEDSKIDLMIANRFIVSLEGNNVPLQKIKKSVNELDLKALEQKAD